MSANAWRLLGVLTGFLIAAGAIGVGLGTLLDSRAVGAITIGILLLGGFLVSVRWIGLHPVNVEGRQLHYHPLLVVGISFLIAALPFVLMDHDAAAWAIQATGLLLFIVGWRRSDIPPLFRSGSRT